ncbi:MAG: hypothetical protein LUJ25_01050 [Firmicutes bacterium]|nr:hypothetical protein [Bacillota bacterium]
MFLPSYAFDNKDDEFSNGMILDFQELDYIVPKDLDRLYAGEIDEKVLNESEKEYLFLASTFSIKMQTIFP